MKLKPDDALAIRLALEPLTHSAISDDDDFRERPYELALTSIAISLKRIADAAEKQSVDPSRFL